ncbi:MAG: ABC transporter ATP-binding protein [Candidatus Buchananbacteria bacterium]
MQVNTKLTLKIFWQYSFKYKIEFFVILLTVMGAASMDAIVPLFFKNLFDILSQGQRGSAVMLALIFILFQILGLSLLRWLFWRTSTFVANDYQSKIMTDLTNYCFEVLHLHSFSFFNNNFSGSLVKKVKWFGKSYEIIADRVIWNLLPMVVSISLMCFVLFRRNLWLGLGIIGWITVFLVINFIFTRYKLKYDVARSEAESETTGFLADTITNSQTVKLFNGYGREVEGFALVNDKLRKLRKFTWDLDSVFQAIQGLFTISLEIGIFYLALTLWQKGILSIGDFVLIQSYLVSIFNRVWDFGQYIRRIYEALSDAVEMTEIINTPFEIKDLANAKKLKVTQAEIIFSNVDFYYHQTRKVLDNFNLTIARQEHLALIGPSGAGKTTIIRLLLRMHDLSAGKILIDHQDIAKVTQESLWQSVSLVPQDPILFHRTLMENIRYGRPKATNQEVIEASRAAHCHEFITHLSDGYNTFVGERGIKLSGGERQRVAIARAILRNAPILVLDEATSSLDSESEMLIQDALAKLMVKKTVIVIAHRLSTIRMMDRIVVLDEGGVVEEGTHENLLKKNNGLYRRLWQLQAGGFIH